MLSKNFRVIHLIETYLHYKSFCNHYNKVKSWGKIHHSGCNHLYCLLKCNPIKITMVYPLLRALFHINMNSTIIIWILLSQQVSSNFGSQNEQKYTEVFKCWSKNFNQYSLERDALYPKPSASVIRKVMISNNILVK